MQEQVAALLGAAAADAERASAATAPIAALDRAKRHMEGACRTLKEATELSGMFRRVEEVLALGDLPRVAELLASMAASLAIVGDVPEFRGGRARLGALEDALQARLDGTLAEALASGADARVPPLAGMLLAVGRYGTVEAAYVSSRLQRLHGAWEDLAAAAATVAAASGPAAAAAAAAAVDPAAHIAPFLQRLTAGLRQEAAWCAAVLPAQRGALLPALVRAVFGRVQRPLLAAVAAPSTGLAALAALAPDVELFACTLSELLADAAPEAGAGALRAALEGWEAALARYGSLEAAHLRAELARGAAADVGGEELEGAARLLLGSLRAAFAALAGGLPRCLALSAGTELPALLRAVDGAAAGHVARLQGQVDAVAARYAAQAGAGAAGADALSGDAIDAGCMLGLLRVSARLADGLASLQASLRSALTATVPRLEAAAAAAAAGAAGAAGGRAPDLLSARLRAEPRAAEPARALLAASREARFLPLPAAAAAADAFGAHVERAVHAALLAPTAAALEAVPGLASWRAAGAEASQLPSFNAYPQPYVTGVGEYLMSLPQQLEGLLLGGGGGGDDDDDGADGPGTPSASAADDSDDAAAAWLDRVVAGVAGAYAEALLRVPELSPGGAGQLAADVEYFANVMAALRVAPPPALLTLQAFAALPADQFPAAGAAAVAAGAADARALRALAAARRLSLAPAAAAHHE